MRAGLPGFPDWLARAGSGRRCFLALMVCYALLEFAGGVVSFGSKRPIGIRTALLIIALVFVIVIVIGVSAGREIRTSIRRLTREYTFAELWGEAASPHAGPLLPYIHASRAFVFLSLGLLVGFYVRFCEWSLSPILILLAAVAATTSNLLGKWRELHFAQVQAVRDQLAAVFFEQIRQMFASIDAHIKPSKAALPGPFILYLRPFAVTNSLRDTTVDSILAAGGLDLEVRIVDALAQWAPVIALGQPGEVWGAGRLQVDEQEWQRAMEFALGAADMILVVPGDQPGIKWELNLLKSEALLSRSVFVRPPRSRMFNDDWWKRATEAMAMAGLSAPDWLGKREGSFFMLDDEGNLDLNVTFGRRSGSVQLRRSLRTLLSWLSLYHRASFSP